MNSINPMYINPAILSALVAIFMLLLAIGGILWNASRNLAASFGEMKTDVAVIRERLDGHIKVCGPQKSHS